MQWWKVCARTGQGHDSGPQQAEKPGDPLQVPWLRQVAAAGAAEEPAQPHCPLQEVLRAFAGVGWEWGQQRAWGEVAAGPVKQGKQASGSVG